jgi:hypothetical protein
VTDKPTRKFYTPTPRSGSDDRPTGPPPFDIEAYAREATAPESERRPPSEPKTHRRPKLKEPEPDSASALLRTIDDAAGPRNTHTPNDDRIAAMRECFSFGDYAGALTIVDLILAGQPNNTVALEFQANSRAALEDVYAFQLGPMGRVPRVVALPELSGRQATDGRVAVLHSLMDGCATLQAIVDVCGMPRLEALRLLHDLNHRGIIAFE